MEQTTQLIGNKHNKIKENFNSLEYCKQTCDKPNYRNRFQHYLCAFKSFPEMFKSIMLLLTDFFLKKNTRKEVSIEKIKCTSKELAPEIHQYLVYLLKNGSLMR